MNKKIYTLGAALMLIAFVPMASAEPVETFNDDCDMPDNIFDVIRCSAGGSIYDICAEIFGEDACKEFQ